MRNNTKNILLSLVAFSTITNAATMDLNTGWNLIGTNSTTSLSEIKNSLGDLNVEVIQGPTKTYQKKYVDDGLEFLNDFTSFEVGKGYWVKLTSSATLTYSEENLSTTTLNLSAGWNLIDPLTDLTIDEIKTQLGSSNTLVVQGPTKTYQKKYVDDGLDFLNDFSTFESGKGYWVQLNEAANLEFTFSSLTINAITNAASSVEFSQLIDGNTYTIRVFTDTNNSGTSQSTIAMYGSIGSYSSTNDIKLSSNYSAGSKFQVKVFNSLDEVVGSSEILTYNSSAIDFGSVTISDSNGGGNDTSSLTNTLSGKEIYVSDNQGVATLQFNSNGTYTEFGQDNGEPAFNCNGTWTVLDSDTVKINCGSSSNDYNELTFATTPAENVSIAIKVVENGTTENETAVITEFGDIGTTTGSTNNGGNTGGQTGDLETPPTPTSSDSTIPLPPSVPNL